MQKFKNKKSLPFQKLQNSLKEIGFCSIFYSFGSKKKDRGNFYWFFRFDFYEDKVFGRYSKFKIQFFPESQTYILMVKRIQVPKDTRYTELIRTKFTSKIYEMIDIFKSCEEE